MARGLASRKYQLTINNPAAHGLTHECIKEILRTFPGLEYWCMCDEVGKEGTPHTHVYLVSRNAIMFSTLQSVSMVLTLNLQTEAIRKTATISGKRVNGLTMKRVKPI